MVRGKARVVLCEVTHPFGGLFASLMEYARNEPQETDSK